MGTAWLGHMTDVSVRSLALAGLAGIFLGVLGRRRTAVLAHAVWASVVAGMLVLFLAAAVIPPLPVRVPRTAAAPARVARAGSGGVRKVAAEARPAGPADTTARDATGTGTRSTVPWAAMVLGLYGVVTAALLARLAMGMRLVWKLRNGSARVEDAPGAGFRESTAIVVPLAAGWLRPVVLLPDGWRSWSGAKLAAVLLHERAHIERRDSLVALGAAVNRCLFWFHPLAWWLERHLALVAEQACDERCLWAMQDREEYASLLVEMAGEVEASSGRIYRDAMAMATGSHIRQRVDRILDDRRRISRGMTRAGWAALLAAAMPLIYVTGATRLLAQQGAAANAGAILVPAIVTDSYDRLVTGLDVSAFHVFEDGVEQPVVEFAESGGPISVAVIFETNHPGSDCVYEPGGFQCTFSGISPQAIAAVFNTFHAGDELFTPGFGRWLPLTEFAPAINVIGGFMPPNANLLEQIDAALRAMATARNKHKAILVLGYGGARTAYSEDDVNRLVRDPDVVIYGAGAPEVINGQYGPEPGTAPLMRELAARSGGRYMTARNLEGLRGAAARIGMEIRNEFVLGYRSAGRNGGEVRNLEVKLAPTRGLPPLHVRARPSRIAAQ